MGSWEFNGSQFLQIGESEKFNPHPEITVEVICQPLESGNNPTLFCRPYNEQWTSPEISWRLGFFENKRLPEFQIHFLGDEKPTTVRSYEPITINQHAHISGTYNGETIRLYVDGRLMAETKKTGTPLKSTQQVIIGGRSSTDQGFGFIGRIFDVRIWETCRSLKEINYWNNKTLPTPLPDKGCLGYWHTSFRFNNDFIEELFAKGFSSQEVSFFEFISKYDLEYSKLAKIQVSSDTRNLYLSEIHNTVVIKANNGFLVFYEPSPATYLKKIPATSNVDINIPGFVTINPTNSTIEETIQGLTNNKVKLCNILHLKNLIPENFPSDLENGVNWMYSQEALAESLELPDIFIDTSNFNEQKVNSNLFGKRLRIISPIITDSQGNAIRAFSWLFADLWFGDVGWDFATNGVAEILAHNDLGEIKQISNALHNIDKPIFLDAKNPLYLRQKNLAEFKKLLQRDNISERRDILPFLSKQENWFLLSPIWENVWPEYQLSKIWRVDFIVKEPGENYLIIEVESPTKQLYKNGKNVDPYADLTHAEQQVLDYCNHIDSNHLIYDRPEELPGIYKPNGIVIIGRRSSLSKEGLQKLKERNTSNPRFTIKTFDDLIDDAETLINRLR